MKGKFNPRLIAIFVITVFTVSAFAVTVLNSQLATGTDSLIVETSSDIVTMNLFVEGVDGESKIAGRENSIDILAYSHSVRWDLGMERSSGSGLHFPLRVMKEIDKATPKLLKYCLEGTTILSVELRFYLGLTTDVYYSIELQNVQVYSVQGYGTTSFYTQESVSFIYEQIKWIYTEYDDLGNSKGNVESGWITANWNTTVIP